MIIFGTSRREIWAARYISSPAVWRISQRRGFSFSDWGALYSSREEVEEAGTMYPAVYSRELRCWTGRLPGLSTAGTGETAQDAIDAAKRSSYGGSWLAVFRAVRVGSGPDGEDLVEQRGRARLLKID